MISKIGTILAFLLVIGTPLIFAEPTYQENLKTYPVEGATRDEILQSIAERGFEEKDGTVCAAHTDWKVSWDLQYFPKSAESCEMRNFKVHVFVDFNYPEWNTPSDSSEPLKKSWSDYSAALRLHEKGHQEIALEAGRAIEAAFSRLTAANNCGELQASADAQGRDLIKKFRKQEKTYDEKTGHGKTQGVDF